MAIKICKDCYYHKRAVVDIGNGQSGMGFVCSHEDCRDPIIGDALPCNIARREIVFCGIGAKFFKEKEEPVTAPVIQLVK